MLPNLVIVGVSKAGTTSLFNYLGQHPEVCSSDLKELRYFSPLRYGEVPAPIDTYAAHFRHCRQQAYAMEATPGYFYGGRPLAQGLRETCTSVRALVSLREPEDRCWSWFQFVKSRTRIPKDMSFGAYLDRCEELRRTGIDGALEYQPFWGMGGGCYSLWLDGWIAEFGDRFRIVFFDDVVDDPRSSVRSICEWLAIDSGAFDDFQFSVDNKTEQYRNRILQQTAVTLNRRGERFFHRHQSLKRLLRRGYYSVNKAAAEPTMSVTERARLSDFYRPYNATLADQLATVGLSLPASWSRPS